MRNKNVNGRRVFLGVEFDNISLSVLMDHVGKAISLEKKLYLAFSNPEFLLNARLYPDLKRYLNSADYNLADGMGIVIADRFQGNRHDPIQRVTGTDFTTEIIKTANENKYSVAFYGGTENVASAIRALLAKDYPNINVALVANGFQSERGDQHVVDTIYETEPDVIMVCLGNPKQERWIQDNLGDLRKGVILGNGGAMDFLSGSVPRAPKLMRKLGVEFIFRLMQDPSLGRLKRQARLLNFLRLVAFDTKHD